jgi:hypothetical protein
MRVLEASSRPRRVIRRDPYTRLRGLKHLTYYLLHHSALNGSITEPILSFLLHKARLRCGDRDSLRKTPKEYAAEEAGKERPKFVLKHERWSKSLKILRGHEEST